MRLPPARWRRASGVVDPPTRPLGRRGGGERAVDERAQSGQMLRRGHDAPERKRSERFKAIVWKEEKSLPHARQDRQASSGAGLWRADRDQKSPVRRCFKSRPPLGGVRRFASGCRSFQGRLTGLLSRSPPTDTRPQARAYWAGPYLFESRPRARAFSPPAEHFCARVSKSFSWASSGHARTPPRALSPHHGTVRPM